METRTSIDLPPRAIVRRPSCGTRFSAISSRAITLIRLTSGGARRGETETRLVQHAVDAVADGDAVLEGFDMDVRRCRAHGLGDHAVDQPDDRCVGRAVQQVLGLGDLVDQLGQAFAIRRIGVRTVGPQTGISIDIRQGLIEPAGIALDNRMRGPDHAPHFQKRPAITALAQQEGRLGTGPVGDALLAGEGIGDRGWPRGPGWYPSHSPSSALPRGMSIIIISTMDSSALAPCGSFATCWLRI